MLKDRPWGKISLLWKMYTFDLIPKKPREDPNSDLWHAKVSEHSEVIIFYLIDRMRLSHMSFS